MPSICDKEGEPLELMSNVPLTIEEEAESLATFLKDEMEVRLQKNPDLDKKMLEDELRTQWPALDIAEKRRYLRDQLGIFDDPLQKSGSNKQHLETQADTLNGNHVLKQGLPLISMHAEQLPNNKSSNALSGNAIIDPNTEDDQLSSVLKSFTLIKANIYTHEGLIENMKKAYESLTICSCKSSVVANSETVISSNLCSINNTCHHFLSRIECKPKICSFHETDCGNRRFSLLANTTTMKKDDKCLFNVVRTINRGYGLKTLASFQQGDLVMEYLGEVIDIAEANRRIIDALGSDALSSITSSHDSFHPLSITYLTRFSPQLNLVLDAGTKGNLNRFINHSCAPNLVTECWIVDGYPRLGLFACRPIEANEELTINYINAQILSTGLMGASCLCGADSCVRKIRLPTAFKLYEGIVNEVKSHLTNDIQF